MRWRRKGVATTSTSLTVSQRKLEPFLLNIGRGYKSVVHSHNVFSSITYVYGLGDNLVGLGWQASYFLYIYYL